MSERPSILPGADDPMPAGPAAGAGATVTDPSPAAAPDAVPSPPEPAATPPAGAEKLRIPIPVLGEDEARRARRARVAAVLARTPAENAESAKGDGRTSQSSLLVMVPIRAGHYEPLKTLLGHIANPPGEDFEINPVIPFLKLRTVHFARLLVHAPSPSAEAPIPEYGGKPQASGPPIPAKLLFSTDFDGPLGTHVDELLEVAGPGLDQVFGHCEGWPGHADRAAAHRFIRRHRLRSNTFYAGTKRRSVEQIRREADLRTRIEAYLDAQERAGTLPPDPVQVRSRVRELVFGEPELAWARERPGPFPKPIFPPGWLDRVFVGAGVAVAAVIFLLLCLVLAWWQALLGVLGLGAVLFGVYKAAWSYLLRLERTDPVIVRDSVKDHTARLVRTEDRIVQNEISSVIYVKKPLWFRRITLRAVLAYVDFSARYLSMEGNLAGIPSIHFARWVIVDGGRRLVFFSNFDGSWENYLGEFVDKSSTGLTGVWSNCVGFPRSQGLTGQGAADEQLFKAYSRDSQVPTQVWYSAYKWLSVPNINDNTRIRLGLYGDRMTADEAQGWLRLFGGGTGNDGVDGAPKPAPAPRAERVALDDVQGLVARSYAPLRHACYVPVSFAPGRAADARRWVGEARARVTPASKGTEVVRAEGEALNLAFTAAGLRALGVGEDELDTFAREFQEGMAGEHRQRTLGDTGPADPARWRWGGPNNPPVHAMLFLFAGSAARLDEMLRTEAEAGAARGVSLAAPLDSIMLPGDREHFGFHDGIAQPRIDGFQRDTESPSAGGMVPAGEVVLGYANAYGRQPATPSVPETGLSRGLLQEAPRDPFDTAAPRRRDLGRNGTYVVFRQLEQDVKAFWTFADARAGADPERRKWLAAKMVGRWPNGAPLVLDPDREPPFDPEKANDFMYGGRYDDLHGDRCPLGAHIRRTNPRDGMGPTPRKSLLVADRHRMLRRGRAYGPPLAPSFDPADVLATGGDTASRGLHFICFNTDIARQFEFVQHTWVNGMKFDGLYADRDPLIGPHPDPETARAEEVGSFTVQRCPVRHREQGVPRFVTMRGGAYLFMPGLKALEYLSKFA